MQNTLKRGDIFEATNRMTGVKQFKVIDEHHLVMDGSLYKSLRHPDFAYQVHQAKLKGSKLITNISEVYINDEGSVLTISEDDGKKSYWMRRSTEQGEKVVGNLKSRKRSVFGHNIITLATAPYVSAGFSEKLYDVNRLYSDYQAQALSNYDSEDDVQESLRGIFQTHHINKNEGDDRPINLVTLPRRIHAYVERDVLKGEITFNTLAKVVRILRLLPDEELRDALTNRRKLNDILEVNDIEVKLKFRDREDLIDIFDTSILGSQDDPFYNSNLANQMTILSYLDSYYKLKRDGKHAQEALQTVCLHASKYGQIATEDIINALMKQGEDIFVYSLELLNRTVNA